MRFALIALPKTLPSEDDIFYERDLAAANAREAHALAIARQLQKTGHEPWLFCAANSALLQNGQIPTFACRNNLIQLWRLWRWQKQAHFAIAAFGQESLKLAHTLQRLHKKDPPRFTAIFLFTAAGAKPRELNWPNAFIAGSQTAAKQLAEQRQKTGNIKVVMPGMDLSEYAWPATPWQKERRFIFGMDASLMPRSGALLLVRAMAAIWQQESLPPWEMRLFGNGPRFEEIMAEAEKLGVLPKIAILETQPLPQVSQLCHVWLAPGSGNDELPPTLWAGFASGLPTVASKTPLHEEWLDQDAAKLVDAENPQQLAKIMLELMRNNDLREKMSGAAGKMRKKISLQAMAERYCRIILECCANKKAGAQAPATHKN